MPGIPPPRGEPAEAALDAVGFAPARAELRGLLPRLEAACGRLLARALKAALEATLDPDDPPAGGKNLPISAAVRLLTGDGRVTGPQAADAVKRIARLSEGGAAFDDPLLAAALRTALAYRPRPAPRPAPEEPA